MAELKACPFCGSGTKIKILVTTGWFAQCSHCGTNSGIRDTQEEAAEAWNRRPAGEESRSLQKLTAIIEIANKRGWNGVDNSKILEEFIETEFEGLDRHIAALRRTPDPDDGLRQAVKILQNRLDGAHKSLAEAKDLIYRLALKVM